MKLRGNAGRQEVVREFQLLLKGKEADIDQFSDSQLKETAASVSGVKGLESVCWYIEDELRERAEVHRGKRGIVGTIWSAVLGAILGRFLG